MGQVWNNTDNRVKRKEVHGWIILETAGRKAIFDVLAENEGAQPLIGQIVLERLDLIIKPNLRKVMPHPRSPETPMIEIFMATSPNIRQTYELPTEVNQFGRSEYIHMSDVRRNIHQNLKKEVKRWVTNHQLFY